MFISKAFHMSIMSLFIPVIEVPARNPELFEKKFKNVPPFENFCSGWGGFKLKSPTTFSVNV